MVSKWGKWVQRNFPDFLVMLENILTDAQVTEIETVIFPAFDSLEKKEKIKVLHRQKIGRAHV